MTFSYSKLGLLTPVSINSKAFSTNIGRIWLWRITVKEESESRHFQACKLGLIALLICIVVSVAALFLRAEPRFSLYAPFNGALKERLAAARMAQETPIMPQKYRQKIGLLMQMKVLTIVCHAGSRWRRDYGF